MCSNLKHPLSTVESFEYFVGVYLFVNLDDEGRSDGEVESGTAAGGTGSSMLEHFCLCCDWAARATTLLNGPVVWDVSVVEVVEVGWVVYYFEPRKLIDSAA